MSGKRKGGSTEGGGKRHQTVASRLPVPSLLNLPDALLLWVLPFLEAPSPFNLVCKRLRTGVFTPCEGRCFQFRSRHEEVNECSGCHRWAHSDCVSLRVPSVNEQDKDEYGEAFDQDEEARDDETEERNVWTYCDDCEYRYCVNCWDGTRCGDCGRFCCESCQDDNVTCWPCFQLEYPSMSGEDPYTSDDYEGGGADRAGVDCFRPRAFSSPRTRISGPVRARSRGEDDDDENW
jgi:hypothetical protein